MKLNSIFPDAVIFNMEALAEINKHYNPSEAYRIINLFPYIGQGNILYTDNYPLEIRDLMESFGYNRNTFYVLIRKLIFHNIIALHKVTIRRHIIYNATLNPYLARRTQTINTNTDFKDISKGLQTIDLNTLPYFPNK